MMARNGLIAGRSAAVATAALLLAAECFRQRRRRSGPALLAAPAPDPLVDPVQLANQAPRYLNAPNVENLISYARYQHALFCIKYANRSPSQRSYRRVFGELAKLTEQYSMDAAAARPALKRGATTAKGSDIDTKIYDDMKYVIEHSPNPDRANQYLNDGLAHHVSQLLSDELMLQLAFAVPGVDNRFFRPEPPSTVDKLNRCCDKYASIARRFYYSQPDDATTATAAPSTDMDYAVLYEFYDGVYKRLVDAETKKTTPTGAALIRKNASLKQLLNKFASELNSLSLSESDYYAASSMNVWSSDQTPIGLDELPASVSSGPDEAAADEPVDLKRKMKMEFVRRNENLLLTILDLIARVDVNEFVELGGLEQLLILYEKRKTDEEFLNVIGNCLCLVSLEGARYRRLFIQSGWLKRLNEMVSARANHRRKTPPIAAATATGSGTSQLDYIYSMMEIIGHKILYNLVQPARSGRPLYSTMIYPLLPFQSPRLPDDEARHHQHAVDVIFIHGLRGSLFRTWRQDDNTEMSKLDKAVSTPSPTPGSDPSPGNVEVISKPTAAAPEPSTPEAPAAIIDKLNTLIESSFSKSEPYSFCWPRDWLARDLHASRAELAADEEPAESYRLLGISYDSLYSLWGQELVDDKKLKLSIKQRATDLVEQLRVAQVGTRPVVWVCHSMGGLIVKQLLVELAEQEESQKNKRRFLKASGISKESTSGSTASSSASASTPASIVDNTKGIVFFSTPHLGSQVAKTFSIFDFALFLSTEVSELSTNNAYLIDLNEKFLRLVRRGAESSSSSSSAAAEKYNILSICENLPTLITLNIYSRTVTEQSANIGVGQFYLVDYKDHLNICKPDSRECFIYKSVLELVKETARAEGCQSCEREQLERQMQASRHFDFFQFTTYT